MTSQADRRPHDRHIQHQLDHDRPARNDTCRDMVAPPPLGANANIAMRYDATQLMAGLTEVLCYGTAVVVEQKRQLTSPCFCRSGP